MRTFLIALCVGLSFSIASTVDAASYCISLNGGPAIEVDFDGSSIYGEGGGPFLWVGTYSSGNAYLSLGYDRTPTRPILHVWNVPNKTGHGRAYTSDGGLEEWDYTWAFCASGIVVEDPGFDVLLGPGAENDSVE